MSASRCEALGSGGWSSSQRRILCSGSFQCYSRGQGTRSGRCSSSGVVVGGCRDHLEDLGVAVQAVRLRRGGLGLESSLGAGSGGPRALPRHWGCFLPASESRKVWSLRSHLCPADSFLTPGCGGPGGPRAWLLDLFRVLPVFPLVPSFSHPAFGSSQHHEPFLFFPFFIFLNMLISLRIPLIH